MEDAIHVEVKAPAVSDLSRFTYSETAPLAGFLGTDSADADKLSEIAAFVRGDSKEFSDIDMLNAVRHLETKLGAPKLGEKRVDVLHAYVKIQRQIDDLSRNRDTLLR